MRDPDSLLDLPIMSSYHTIYVQYVEEKNTTIKYNHIMLSRVHVPLTIPKYLHMCIHMHTNCNILDIDVNLCKGST